MIRLLTLMLMATASAAGAQGYDPLKPLEGQATSVKLEVNDTKRNRRFPVKVYLPAAKDPVPVILFSHGLGGSCEGSAFLGKHWAARGYVAVFLQHPGSDTSVWKGKPLGQRMAAMRKAANLQNTLYRVRDVAAAIDQLTTWNKTKDHALQERLDLSRIGMSGHSFGAVTTQLVSGQTNRFGRNPFNEPRIKASVIMSPSSPRGGSGKRAFSSVKIPWMLMTGTKDTSPIGNSTVESRLAVFPALPNGDKYELVLNRAEHSVFTERKLPGEKEKRNPNHHRVILALSTAFWDAYLRKDEAAKIWLKGEGPRSIMEKADRWQLK